MGSVNNGEVWFVGKDVATALGYSNTRDALAKHVDDEDKKDGVAIRDAIGREQFATVINESGLYSLILSSKLPEAKKFKRWVTSEVLPAIRKTGSYSLPQVEKAVAVQNQPPVLHKLLDDINKSSKLLQEIFKVKNGIALAKSISVVEKFNCVDLSEVKELLPPAEHKIGYLTPTQLAKKFGLKSAQAVNQKLLELGFQEKDGYGGYILTEKGAQYGEAIHYEKNGHAGYQIKWTLEDVTFD